MQPAVHPAPVPGAHTPAFPDSEFTIALHLDDGYRQLVDFDVPGVPSLVVDEPTPLGTGAGPNHRGYSARRSEAAWLQA